jgi:hypothetical protein
MRLNKYDRLNNRIDLMQAGKSPWRAGEGERVSAEEVAILRMAALLNSLRDDADRPDPHFTVRLREHALAETANGR